MPARPPSIHGAANDSLEPILTIAPTFAINICDTYVVDVIHCRIGCK